MGVIGGKNNPEQLEETLPLNRGPTSQSSPHAVPPYGHAPTPGEALSKSWSNSWKSPHSPQGKHHPSSSSSSLSWMKPAAGFLQQSRESEHRPDFYTGKSDINGRIAAAAMNILSSRMAWSL